MNKSESIVKLSAALLKAQKSMGNAVKDAKNPFFKSSYANLNSVREAVTPALNDNGISVLQPTVEINGQAFVETVLLHESGEWLSGTTAIVVGKANDPQAAGSGISYARRYGLQSLLSIGAEDDDGEAAMGRGKAPSNAPSREALVSQPAGVVTPPASSKPSTFAKKPATAPAAETTGGGWEN